MLDDPNVSWMKRLVRVKRHPEWGVARVMRWFPAGGGQPERLRIMAQNEPAPKLVTVTDVELV